MKAIKLIGIVVLFAPALMVCNENEHIWPNIVGFIYILFMVRIMRTNFGKNIARFLESFVK